MGGSTGSEQHAEAGEGRWRLPPAGCGGLHPLPGPTYEVGDVAKDIGVSPKEARLGLALLRPRRHHGELPHDSRVFRCDAEQLPRL